MRHGLQPEPSRTRPSPSLPLKHALECFNRGRESRQAESVLIKKRPCTPLARAFHERFPGRFLPGISRISGHSQWFLIGCNPVPWVSVAIRAPRGKRPGASWYFTRPGIPPDSAPEARGPARRRLPPGTAQAWKALFGSPFGYPPSASARERAEQGPGRW